MTGLNHLFCKFLKFDSILTFYSEDFTKGKLTCKILFVFYQLIVLIS